MRHITLMKISSWSRQNQDQQRRGLQNWKRQNWFTDYSYPGLFVPSIRCTFHTLDVTTRNMDCSGPHGLFVPWMISSSTMGYLSAYCNLLMRLVLGLGSALGGRIGLAVSISLMPKILHISIWAYTPVYTDHSALATLISTNLMPLLLSVWCKFWSTPYV